MTQGPYAGVLAGAYDLHTHPAPDIVPRSQSILDAAHGFAAAGLGGFVVKSHVTSTAAVCAAARTAAAAEPVGSIALNRPVGGLNPGAVEVAAQLGARVVWLPTVDSRAQRAVTVRTEGGPVWAGRQAALAARRGYGPAIDILDADGVVPALHDVLDVVAEYDLLLGTGHLDAPEVFAVLAAAAEHGVERVVVTHPDLPQQRITPAEQTEMARRGAFIERTWNAILAGKSTREGAVCGIRSCGLSRTLLTGDLGQPENGPIVGGLTRWAQVLTETGFSTDEARLVLTTNSRSLLGLS